MRQRDPGISQLAFLLWCFRVVIKNRRFCAGLGPAAEVDRGRRSGSCGSVSCNPAAVFWPGEYMIRIRVQVRHQTRRDQVKVGSRPKRASAKLVRREPGGV